MPLLQKNGSVFEASKPPIRYSNDLLPPDPREKRPQFARPDRQQGEVLRAVDSGCKVTAGRFTLDRHDCSVKDDENGVVMELTRLQYKLLDVLMRNCHQPVARDVLRELVWNRDASFRSTNIVEVMVNYLRKKLGERSILTKPGHGYQFNPQEASLAR